MAALALLASTALTAEGPAPGDTGATNDLVFKKRTRRRYDSVVIVDPAPVALPAAPEAAPPVISGGPDTATDSPAIDLSRPHPGSRPLTPARPGRPARRPETREEDWLLSPEQRLARELARISGIEPEEKTDTEEEPGWLASDIRVLEEQRRKKHEEEARLREEEEEAEQIAAILGRDLLATLRSDTTSSRMFGFGGHPTESGMAGLRTFSTNASPSQQSREPPEVASQPPLTTVTKHEPRIERPEETGSAALRGAPDSRSAAGPAALAGGERGPSRPSADAPPAWSASPDPPAPTPSVAPPLFDWSPRGGGYAGLPSSVAPSPQTRIAGLPRPPPALSPSSPGSWTPSAASEAASGGGSRTPSFSPFASSTLAPATPAERRPAIEPIRTPFLAPAPGTIGLGSRFSEPNPPRR